MKARVPQGPISPVSTTAEEAAEINSPSEPTTRPPNLRVGVIESGRLTVPPTAEAVGRVDVGRAEVDVDLLDQFGIDLLAGEDGIVAAVVELDAVEGEADARRIEAADGERAARRAISVIVLEADARDQVDRVEDRLAGILAGDHLLRQDRLRLGRVRRLDAADVAGSRVPVTTIVSSSNSTEPVDWAKAAVGITDGRRAKQNKFFHVETPTRMNPTEIRHAGAAIGRVRQSSVTAPTGSATNSFKRVAGRHATPPRHPARLDASS